MAIPTYPEEQIPSVYRHPGEQLNEIFRSDQLITDRIPALLQVDRKTVDLFMKGKYNIVPAFAERLEHVTGIRAEHWMSMQIEYDQHLLHVKYTDKYAQLWKKDARGCRMRKLYF